MFGFVLGRRSRLAHGVDVARQVEHLVREAPLVEGDTSYPLRSLRSHRTKRLD